MKNKFYSFALRFSIYVALIMLVSLIIYYRVPQISINPEFVYILLILYVVTLVSFYFFIKSVTEKISRFANVYMLGTFAKLIVYSVIIFVYAWFNRENAVSFIITFFIYYLLLTVYEVVVLMKNPG